MNLPRYEDYEEQFLEAMATRFCFSGKTEIVFVQRLLEANGDLEDKRLAEVLEKQLIEGTKAGDAATIVRDRLKAICDQLAEEGCNFNGTTKGRWKIAKRWLREVKFPEWLQEQGLVKSPPLSLDQLWQQLRDIATPTNKMGPVPAGNLEMWSAFQECVSLGTNIHFVVNLDRAGYLMLVEKATSGNLYCLCPSLLASQPYYPAGRAILPHESSPRKSFTITGNPGKEQIVAVITKELPNLDWLPKGNQPPLEMREQHLNQLLAYLNHRPDSQVLYMEYTVTA